MTTDREFDTLLRSWFDESAGAAPSDQVLVRGAQPDGTHPTSSCVAGQGWSGSAWPMMAVPGCTALRPSRWPRPRWSSLR